MIDRRKFLFGAVGGLTIAGCRSSRVGGVSTDSLPTTAQARKLIAAARNQVGVTLHYDAAYTRFKFPGGDVPRERGVCTDVLVRSYRDAFALDLQLLLNADMRAHFEAYPRVWGLSAPDPSIDHRRVPNLATWLTRRHAARPLPSDPSGWQPGDIFTSLVAGTGTHIGLVSDRAGRRSPLIIHNIGAGVREEDALLQWPITGRFRWAVA